MRARIEKWAGGAVLLVAIGGGAWGVAKARERTAFTRQCEEFVREAQVMEGTLELPERGYERFLRVLSLYPETPREHLEALRAFREGDDSRFEEVAPGLQVYPCSPVNHWSVVRALTDEPGRWKFDEREKERLAFYLLQSLKDQLEGSPTLIEILLGVSTLEALDEAGMIRLEPGARKRLSALKLGADGARRGLDGFPRTPGARLLRQDLLAAARLASPLLEVIEGR